VCERLIVCAGVCVCAVRRSGSEGSAAAGGDVVGVAVLGHFKRREQNLFLLLTRRRIVFFATGRCGR
jgi:hypothetical protein